MSNPNPYRLAFVQSCWHENIVEQLRSGFADEIESKNPCSIDYFKVPGAFELPLFCQRLAKDNYHAIIAAGFVVDGGIYRHEFVAAAVIDGLMRVQLDSNIPIFSAVLTPHQFQETKEHSDFFQTHFFHKGQEVARACQNQLAQLQLFN